MQIINKGTNNVLVFTLREKQTLTSPTFLFSLKSQVEMTEKNFLMADTSDYPERYNKFLLTETSGTEDLTSGVVNFSDNGFYEYAIYEQSSTSNLNPNNAFGLLETGLIKVIGTATTHKAHSLTKSIKTYGE